MAGSIGVTAQSILFSPLGATLNLVASNSNPAASFSDRLAGLANSYTGRNTAKSVTDIPRYAAATLTAQNLATQRPLIAVSRSPVGRRSQSH